MTTHLRNILITAARKVGDVQKEILRRGSFDLKPKYDTGTSADLVTEADIESERVLREYFKEVMLEYNLLGEEFGGEYNGNGKVILVDPLDGTRHFREGRARFGPLIGIYEQGLNVGGIAYNVLQDWGYVATAETGWEQLGAAADSWRRDVIYIGGELASCPTFQDDLAGVLRKSFPDNPIIARSGEHDVLHQGRVCDGKWAVYFHAGQGRHDFAATPIFGRLTGTKVTDHNGNPYDSFDAELEAAKYESCQHGILNSSTVLVAKEPYFQKMLEVLQPYKSQLDRRQTPGRRDSLKLPPLKI